MLTNIVLIVVVLVGVILGYAATRPNSLHVERSATIAAPPDAIARFINDFHLWNMWSPYEGRDPALKRVFSGAPAGKGAVYEWNGNKSVGQGRMEITDTQPSRITIKLDFIAPFEGHNVVVFAFQPNGGSTTVTWTMDGPTSYTGKLMGMVINMDRMIGKDYETGLANLKGIAEKRSSGTRTFSGKSGAERLRKQFRQKRIERGRAERLRQHSNVSGVDSRLKLWSRERARDEYEGCRRSGLVPANPLVQRHSTHIRHLEVAEDHVIRMLLEQDGSGMAVFGEVNAESTPREQTLQQLPQGRLVVDDERAPRAHGRHGRLLGGMRLDCRGHRRRQRQLKTGAGR